MRRRIVGVFMAGLFCLAPARGFGDEAVELSEWKLKMLDPVWSVQLLNTYYQGKVANFEEAFLTFLEEIRTAMMKDAKFRLLFWQHLEQILKTLNPTKTYLTQSQFDAMFLLLANSKQDFGWMATKLLWNVEAAVLDNMYQKGAADLDYMGLYVGWHSSGKIFLFPANYVLDSLTTNSAPDGRKDLATSIVHEFLHHVAHVLYTKHYLPEGFREPLATPILPGFFSESFSNHLEHLWIYKVEENVLTLLDAYMVWTDARAPTRPTVAWLMHRREKSRRETRD